MPMPQAFIQTRFISDDVREELQKRSEAARSAPPALAMGLPEDLPGYHSLVALEPTTPERRRFGNWFTTVYKAVGEKDGVTYALRRVESTCRQVLAPRRPHPRADYLLTQQASLKPIDQWSRIRHPNIVGVQEGFTTRVFGDNCPSSRRPRPRRELTYHSARRRLCVSPKRTDTCGRIPQAGAGIDDIDADHRLAWRAAHAVRYPRAARHRRG
jgi:hypothetical protein